MNRQDIIRQAVKRAGTRKPYPGPTEAALKGRGRKPKPMPFGKYQKPPGFHYLKG